MRILRAAVVVTFLAGGVACAGTQDPRATAPGISGTPKMTFEECQKSAEYGNGSRYGVSYDNGVCTVQKP